jgi:hypothetical protein
VSSARQLLPLILALLASSAAYAAALSMASGSIDQLGRGEAPVNRYYVRLLSASINVNNNAFNNQITGGSVSVASTIPGTYLITITVSTNAGSRTYTTTASLSPTQTTITFTLNPALPYTAPGATISVRADPA